MEKKEFKKIIKTVGFSSQGKFAELIGIKANTFTTYKKIPHHVVRIARLSLLARDNGVSLEDIKKHLLIQKQESKRDFLDTNDY